MSDQIEREQQIEEESLTKNSLQIQKAAWIREELEKRRAQEDQLLQQILREQQMLQELDEDMDQNMAHAKEGRRYREDMKARVDDRVYEMHDLSADKREGMREYGYAYRRGYALAMVFFSLALCVFAGYLHGIASQTCLVLMFFTGVQAAILVHKKQCPKFWKFVCDVFSALIFPGMLILFIGCELHYSYYERALPYCLAVGLFLLALTTASYFLYDPYRSARRRVGDAKSMIRSIERSAKKQVKKNQKQQIKEELRQDRLQKKESEKLLKIQQKQEVRLEKQGKRLQKWETWKQQFLERFQKSEDIVDEEVSDETLPDAAAGDETLPEEAVVDEALRKDTVVDEALPKETAGNEHCRQNPGKKIRMIRTFDTWGNQAYLLHNNFHFRFPATSGCYRNRGLTCFFGGQLTGLFIDRNNLWVRRRKRFAIRAAIRFYFDRCLRGRIFFHGKCGFRELNTCCFHIGIDQITISFVGVGTFQ